MSPTFFGASFGASAEALDRRRRLGENVERLLETKFAEPPVLAGADEASQDKPLNRGEIQQW